MNDAKEEIRERLPIEEVVGQYVELKRAGRNLKGRSPWGVDRTPSFMVSPEKGIWHDFSANKGGDIFTFVMEAEGITFKEALEKLAAQAGVELAKYSGGDAAVTKRKVRMRELLEWACQYYQFCLSKNKRVCDYVFYKRRMNKKTVQNFRVGYAPQEGAVLVEWLKKKGYMVEEMRAAGLLNRFDHDFFRGRMIVPFIDTGGVVIGFTARVLDNSEPKYLNTPETLLFNKGRFIFGLYQAKEAIRQEGFVVVVEGNMDVISSHQAGVSEAVATSGTAMTEQHLKALGRLTKDIRLAYDGDEAGVRATERAIMMAGDLGLNLTVVSDYHGAKDPDELIQRDPKLWQEAVQHAVPAVEWLLDKYEERLDLTTGTGKREYSDVAMKLIGHLNDAVERKHYEQLVARRLEVEVADLRAKRLDGGKKRYLKKVKTVAESDRARVVEQNLLALVVYGGVPEVERLEMPEDERVLAELELIYQTRYANWDAQTLAAEARELAAELRRERMRREVAELTAELAAVEDDDERTRELLRKITELGREIEKIK